MTGEYQRLTAADLEERWRLRHPFIEIDESVGAVDSPIEYSTHDTALRWTLKLEWDRLQDARRSAINTEFSVQCGWIIQRIVGLTSLVGPTAWQNVPCDLIVDGWYERIHAAMGRPTPLSDDDRARARAVIDRRSIPVWPLAHQHCTCGHTGMDHPLPEQKCSWAKCDCTQFELAKGADETNQDVSDLK